MCKYDWTHPKITPDVKYIATDQGANNPVAFKDEPRKGYYTWKAADLDDMVGRLDGVTPYVGSWRDSLEPRPCEIIIQLMKIAKALGIYKPVL